MPARDEAPPGRCPKCRGFMVVERDQYGTVGTCLNCAYTHDVVREPLDLTVENLPPGRSRKRKPAHGRMLL